MPHNGSTSGHMGYDAVDLQNRNYSSILGRKP